MAGARSGRPVERDRDLRRFTAQLLTGPPPATPIEVVDRLLAVQAQDFRAARLAIRSRTEGLTVGDVDRELDERSLVITWLNRGTLHLVRTEDYWWLQRLTTPQLHLANARRLEQEGVSPAQADRGVATIETSLADQGPLTRGELREQVASADVPVAGQALVHILFLAALRGVAVRGPVAEGEQMFVLVADWLGRPPRAGPRERDLTRLARRYLAGHGPAAVHDLARWAGITVGDARRGLGAIDGELEELPGDLVDLAGRPDPARALPAPRLLGGYDPLLHGWTSREPVLGDNTTIVTSNGLFRPFALVRGRAVATWRLPQGGVVLEPFLPIAVRDRAALDRDAADVERFLAG